MNLTDPKTGCLHLALYTEARRGIDSSSLNAKPDIEAFQTVTPHLQEWLSRLVRCEPNAMHCTLVGPTKNPALFHPCVTEDKDSPLASEARAVCADRPSTSPSSDCPSWANTVRRASARACVRS
jgi:hypothetical protein